MDNHIPFVELDRATKKVLDTLSNLKYCSDTITNYRRILVRVRQFSEQNGYCDYSEEVGNFFLEENFRVKVLSASYSRALKTVVRRLNDAFTGAEFVLHHNSKTDFPPSSWERTLSQFLQACEDKGNHPNTIKIKAGFLSKFLHHLVSLNATEPSQLNPKVIIHGCLHMSNKGSYAVIREFLMFLYEISDINADYSRIVPRYTKPFKLPTTYSHQEIQRLEGAFDRTTTIGKRNYAMILLATRLGLRSGDIVGLRFCNLNFNNNNIRFNQAKTGNEHELPMLPELKFALLDYISAARPCAFDSDYVFLSSVAPHGPLTTSAIRRMLTGALEAAGVDFVGKKHGAHTLRASLASSMVNDGVPYEAVRKVLGHTAARSITHYAKVDINRHHGQFGTISATAHTRILLGSTRKTLQQRLFLPFSNWHEKTTVHCASWFSCRFAVSAICAFHIGKRDSFVGVSLVVRMWLHTDDRNVALLGTIHPKDSSRLRRIVLQIGLPHLDSAVSLC